MKVLDLFGLKFFKEEYALKFRYVVFLNQLKPKIYFQKQLTQFDVIHLDEGLSPKVSTKPDMEFIMAIVSRLLEFFEKLEYSETKNAIIYYTSKEGVYMLSKSTLTPTTSKGIAPKSVIKYNHMPEYMIKVLDNVVQQIINYYVTHFSNVLMYYHSMKRV